MLHASLKCSRFIVYKNYAELSMKIILLINVKGPTIVGNLTLMSRINTTSKSSKARVILIISVFEFLLATGILCSVQ